jgi:hypothetical protein
MSETAETQTDINEEKSASSEDIERVKQLRTKYATTTAQIGQVEIELHISKKRVTELEKFRESLLDNYIKLQTEEQNLVKELNEKYGDGILDLEANKFVPASTTV